MRVLVACEFSGRVRDAFIAIGHDAISCDLLPTERPGPHIQDDVSNHLCDSWDMMIAFPPCTYLCNSGARWWRNRRLEQQFAIDFVDTLFNAPISHIAIENPTGILSTVFGKPDQVIEPWQFGEPFVKRTCLWLDGIPPLLHTDVFPGPFITAIYNEAPGPNRQRNRSRTYNGIATAMANQWGNICQ